MTSEDLNHYRDSWDPRYGGQNNRYVYLYIDPRTNKVFYIGRGKGYRVFSHLITKDNNRVDDDDGYIDDENSIREKIQRINSIRANGLEPDIDILYDGMDLAQAKIAEAATIDLLGINNLTNMVRGYNAQRFPLSTTERIREDIVVHDTMLLVGVNKYYNTYFDAFYDHNNPEHQIKLKILTSFAWKVGRDRIYRERPIYFCPVYFRTVLDVFAFDLDTPIIQVADAPEQGILHPMADNLGYSLFGYEDFPLNEDRIEFDRWILIGSLADDETRRMYRGKKTCKMPQIGFTYLYPNNN